MLKSMPMQRFILSLLFLLNIGFTCSINAQIEPSYLRFDLPSFIPEHSRFDASLIFKIDEVSDDDIFIKFEKPNELNIISASVNTILGKFELDLYHDEDDINHFSLMLNSNELGIEANTPYQIILHCNTDKSGKILKSLFRGTADYSNNFEGISSIKEDELFIYNIQKTAGECLSLEQNSNLLISIKSQEWQNLLFEFWNNFNGNQFQNIYIVNTETRDTLLNLSKNELQFLSIPLDENEIVRNDVFLGTNTWNFISVLLNRKYSGNYCDLYVNNELIYSKKIVKSLDFAKLNLSFENKSENGALLLERLKIWNWNNNISLSQKNKYFLDFETDSSSVIYNSNFDDIDLSKFNFESKDLSVSSSNIKFTKSFAPIFSKAPKLNVNIGNSYNSLVWYVQEYSVAEEFFVERAIDKNPFEEIYKTMADEDPLKIYYYTDELINANEVAYYRVKQINKDGSVVYSPEIKIGNKDFTEFNLLQNYPNPFNPITSIYLEVIVPAEFKVKVYDLVGNTIAILHQGFLSEGQHKFDFDGSNLPSGIYFYEAISPKSQSVKKMILAK